MSDQTAAPRLRRLRLQLPKRGSVLLLVGDRFDDGSRYVQQELPQQHVDSMSWLEWDDLYDRLAEEWRSRFSSRNRERTRAESALSAVIAEQYAAIEDEARGLLADGYSPADIQIGICRRDGRVQVHAWHRPPSGVKSVAERASGERLLAEAEALRRLRRVLSGYRDAWKAESVEEWDLRP